ncbi:MAG: hypothetical protein NT037_16105 [Hyphomicrobiales bacterium]|nr:hypothetical protein [Hyphomicrobiales bacterium]
MPLDDDDAPTLKDAIFNLALAIVQLETGPLARLRRMKVDGPGEADFWKLALNQQVRLRTDESGLMLVHLMALLTPKGEPGGKRLHDTKTPFGQALATAGYPETRLLRFLARPFAARADELETMVRWLAAKGHDGVNCVDLACLLWSNDVTPTRNLARHYFDTIRKLTNTKDDAA